MKRLIWLGNSREVIREFPSSVQHAAGVELLAVQRGEMPGDSKPMPAVGKGVEEIRVWAEAGTYRVMYIARLAEAVYVLHAFQKKTQQTSQREIELARARLARLMQERR